VESTVDKVRRGAVIECESLGYDPCGHETMARRSALVLPVEMQAAPRHYGCQILSRETCLILRERTFFFVGRARFFAVRLAGLATAVAPFFGRTLAALM